MAPVPFLLAAPLANSGKKAKVKTKKKTLKNAVFKLDNTGDSGEYKDPNAKIITSLATAGQAELDK